MAVPREQRGEAMSAVKADALKAICEAEVIATTDRVSAALHLLAAGVWTVDEDGTVRAWWARNNGEATPQGGKALSPHLLTLPGGLRVSTAAVVWSATHGRPVPEGCQVKHLDGDLGNNSPDNLRAVTLAAERAAPAGQLALLDVPAVDVVRKPEAAPRCAPAPSALAPTLGLDGMAEVEPMGVPRGPMVEVMEQFDVSVSEIVDVTGDEMHDVRMALHGLGELRLYDLLLDVAHDRLHLAASALRLDPSRPELWETL